MTPAELVGLYPVIYHMAEPGTWESIRDHGLLSSNEVARRSGATGEAALALRRHHRPANTTVDVPGIGRIVLRDQIPMPPARIQRTLPDGLTSADWYELINDRVFLWAEEHRLHRLLNARHYRDLEHDVLTVDTSSLVAGHAGNIRLCHMNSGNTFPAMTRRSPDIFKPIADYELTRNGRPRKKVVEVTVLHGIPDIASHVREVKRMRGSTVLHTIQAR